MTKPTANTIKKLVSSFCSCYYQSNTKTLRVCAYQYINNDYDKDAETKRLIRVLNTLSANSIRTPFQIERKTYQGFVHRTYLIFG